MPTDQSLTQTTGCKTTTQIYLLALEAERSPLPLKRIAGHLGKTNKQNYTPSGKKIFSCFPRATKVGMLRVLSMCSLYVFLYFLQLCESIVYSRQIHDLSFVQLLA